MRSYYHVLKTWAYDRDSQMFSKSEGASEIYSLLEMRLDTGKKHQLRLACSNALGAPIIGDRKYGYTQANDLFRKSFKYTATQERQLLHDCLTLHSKELSVPTKPHHEAPLKTFTCDYSTQFQKIVD